MASSNDDACSQDNRPNSQEEHCELQESRLARELSGGPKDHVDLSVMEPQLGEVHLCL